LTRGVEPCRASCLASGVPGFGPRPGRSATGIPELDAYYSMYADQLKCAPKALKMRSASRGLSSTSTRTGPDPLSKCRVWSVLLVDLVDAVRAGLMDYPIGQVDQSLDQATPGHVVVGHVAPDGDVGDTSRSK